MSESERELEGDKENDRGGEQDNWLSFTRAVLVFQNDSIS